MTPHSVLIAGGYGAFGARAADRLLRKPDIDLVIAGRDIARANAAVAALLGTHPSRTIAAAQCDAATATAADLAKIGCGIVLNASGPFQKTPPALARACIGAGCHYVDLADDRAFVTGIGTLDAAAKANNVVVVSGASTVPAISAAVIDQFRSQFSRLDAITYGVSPGNSFDPGLATVRSVLSYIGKPFPMRRDGRNATVHGWQDLHHQRFGTLGNRWLSACDIPDLALFPARYPEIETLRFGAGVEVGVFHLSLWALSWFVRAGLLPRPERLAKPLLRLKRGLRRLGSDAGGMAMTLDGVDLDGKPKQVNWSLIARSGHGPMIPPTPAVIVIGKLLDGTLKVRGAQPCLDLVTLPEIQSELADLDMEFAVS